MSSPWDDFSQEVALCHGLGQPVQCWWRDDDAHGATPELSRLFSLARDSALPLALAVIPLGLQAAAFDAMPLGVEVLQHGADHVNRAGGTEKKTEFPQSEPVDSAMDRLLQGRQRLTQAFGDRALPVLAPPWNRFPGGRFTQLAGAGYVGISTFQKRHAEFPVPGLRQCNTHVDIIDWQGGRGFVGEARALEMACAHLRTRRPDPCDAGEPLGWLTHHAVHDAAAWVFLARLFERSRRMPGLRWLRAGEIFTARPV
jgi:hypothetical protein